MCKRGDCLIIETGKAEGGRNRAHLFFVLMDPYGEEERTIIVDMETLDSPKQDQTTLLKEGEQEFVRHNSYINYSRARIVTVARLRALLKERRARRHSLCDPDLLARITAGLTKSTHTRVEVVEFYEDCLFARARASGSGQGGKRPR
jgi:hypothetical protein